MLSGESIKEKLVNKPVIVKVSLFTRAFSGTITAARMTLAFCLVSSEMNAARREVTGTAMADMIAPSVCQLAPTTKHASLLGLAHSAKRNRAHLDHNFVVDDYIFGHCGQVLCVSAGRDLLRITVAPSVRGSSVVVADPNYGTSMSEG